MDPVPPPTTNPQSSIKCQGRFMYWVHQAPVPTIVNANITTLRIPKRSIKAAAKGAVNPYTSTFMETAELIAERDQPNDI